MTRTYRSLRRLTGLSAIMLAVATDIVLMGAPASAATGPCSDVDIAFARGTDDAGSLGIVGMPFTAALSADLAGKNVSTYAVNYPGDRSQLGVGIGATDLANHISGVAAACPFTTFVIAGYSQGATVVTIALDVTLPPALAPRVAAVVTWGNPFLRFGVGINPLYGNRTDQVCNFNDPICSYGNDFSQHVRYAADGSAARGAAYAAGKVSNP